jgi:2'-5' RNA ligase
MPRLFVGLELPEPVKDQILDLEQPLPGTRWIAADDLHVTLRFIGDVDKRTADDVIEALAHIDLPMFSMRLVGLGTFGSKEPRSVWAGVDAPEMLKRLQSATEKAARTAGLPPETRNFRPHVTIARIGKGHAPAIARYLNHHSAFKTEPFPVPRFAVFSAKPMVGGGPYVIEEVFGLQGGSWDDDEDDEAADGHWQR